MPVMTQSSGRLSVAVLGAGSWGTALAMHLARNDGDVRLWGHHPEHMARLRQERRNEQYLPGLDLPEGLLAYDDLAAAVAGVDVVLIVVPSHAFRGTLVQLKPLLQSGQRIAWASKGLEEGSGKLLPEVFAEELGEAYPAAIVSGPTFALEVARGLPTAVTVASTNGEFANDLASRLHDTTFRAYTSDDVIGVSLGGAAKNVLAIAAGIADGLGFGANTRAALITRGLHEIMRLGVALGGHPETFMGLAGLGDLVLTCTDDQSRNRRLGLALGQGQARDKATSAIGQVVEGASTARELHRVASRHGLEMPISEQVYCVLYDGVTPEEAVTSLFAREPKPEIK